MLTTRPAIWWRLGRVLWVPTTICLCSAFLCCWLDLVLPRLDGELPRGGRLARGRGAQPARLLPALHPPPRQEFFSLPGLGLAAARAGAAGGAGGGRYFMRALPQLTPNIITNTSQRSAVFLAAAAAARVAAGDTTHCTAGCREENSSVALVHKNDSYGAIMFAIVLTEVNLHNFRKQKREIGRLG